MHDVLATNIPTCQGSRFDSFVWSAISRADLMAWRIVMQIVMGIQGLPRLHWAYRGAQVSAERITHIRNE